MNRSTLGIIGGGLCQIALLLPVRPHDAHQVYQPPKNPEPQRVEKAAECPWLIIEIHFYEDEK